ncbi:hypothetical protein SK128_014841 [Halocaridina rubra]|uniref:Uncharacterized protein n=1 Tax=Halocaridina rubra TaxID=373956 RepID=A0AAN8X3Y3_HALRR
MIHDDTGTELTDLLPWRWIMGEHILFWAFLDDGEELRRVNVSMSTNHLEYFN